MFTEKKHGTLEDLVNKNYYISFCIYYTVGHSRRCHHLQLPLWPPILLKTSPPIFPLQPLLLPTFPKNGGR
ncbi:MAG: hypothetical protein DYG98_02710 [Haliscomenobacteraceae bacterium CHB4]|nr:hypothetical protein [Haliscomenobacteraceae bacterium CHB4]